MRRNKSIKILWIEDDEYLVSLFKEEFEKHKFSLIHLKFSEDIETIDLQKISFVILDVMLINKIKYDDKSYKPTGYETRSGIHFCLEKIKVTEVPFIIYSNLRKTKIEKEYFDSIYPLKNFKGWFNKLDIDVLSLLKRIHDII